jgi:ankyrin repeat protein
MSAVFISYRRSDSGGWSGRLYDRLRERLGPTAVFYDVDSLRAGEDFVAAIEERLSKSQVAVVVIGPGWANARADDGTRRLDHEDDLVRKEVQMALGRPVTVIPVLVGGVKMPSAAELPPPIAALARRNAMGVSDVGFNDDVERIIRAILNVTGAGERSVDGAASSRAQRSIGKFLRQHKARAFAIALACIGIAGIALLLVQQRPSPIPPIPTPPEARLELERAHVDYSANDFVSRAEKGNLHAVELYLAAGMKPDEVGENSFGGHTTALIAASAKGDSAMVAALIKAGANVNYRDEDGDTPLSIAVSRGNAGIARMLLEKGANVESINKAFIRAAIKQNHDLLRMLAKKGADLQTAGPIALVAASAPVGDDGPATATATVLLDLGVPVNGRDKEGWTALHWAALGGRASLTALLLRRGADVNVRCECTGVSDGGWTPVLLAIMRKHVEVAESLLAHGPDLTIKNNRGANALLLATNDPEPPILHALLKMQVDVNEKSDSGRTPLMELAGGHAWPYGTPTAYPDEMGMLLEKGSRVNEKDTQGHTALMFAAWSGSTEVVQALLAKGARAEDKDADGKTARDYARKGKDATKTAAVIRLLQAAGKS